MRESRLSLSTKLNYAVGQIGIQMLVAGVSFFLMIFYTDVAMVSPAVASAALLLGKVWYTLSDPLFGFVVDRTRSRHGRRRVYLIYFGLPLAVLAAAIWMVPPGLSPAMAFIWIATSYILYETVHTLVHLPYYAMAAEMTDDYDERTSLMAFSSLGALVGYVIGSVLMPVIVRAAPNAQLGYTLAGGVFGVVAGVCVAWVAWRVREPALTHIPQPKDAPWRSMRLAFRSRPFVLMAFGCAMGRVGLTLAQGGLAYFVVYQLQGEKAELPKLLGQMLLVVALSIPAWKWLVDRWEKNYVYICGLCLAAAGFMVMFWLQPGQQQLTWLGLGLIGLGMGAHWVVPFSMLPDTIDFAHAQTGEHRTGMYYGLFGLIDKLARTLGTVAIGWILQWFHYVPNVAQSAESLLGIRLTVGLLPACFVLAAVPLLLAYPISRRRHADLRGQLKPAN
jgi:GPH family glycoside/pentoside/hexuronide:cation symporter